MIRTGPEFEAALARIYVDMAFRERFLADPKAVALEARLSEEEAEALKVIDRAGLELASLSFAQKRMRH